jgi:hypothetical protein
VWAPSAKICTLAISVYSSVLCRLGGEIAFTFGEGDIKQQVIGCNTKCRIGVPCFSTYGQNFTITMRWLSMLCSQEILKGSILPKAKKRYFEFHPKSL